MAIWKGIKDMTMAIAKGPVLEFMSKEWEKS